MASILFLFAGPTTSHYFTPCSCRLRSTEIPAAPLPDQGPEHASSTALTTHHSPTPSGESNFGFGDLIDGHTRIPSPVQFTQAKARQANANIATDGAPLPASDSALLRECYSPTCSRDLPCHSIDCPRRLEQQSRLRPGLKNLMGEESLGELVTTEPGALNMGYSGLGAGLGPFKGLNAIDGGNILVSTLAWNANHNLTSVPPQLGASREQNDLPHRPLTRLGYDHAWRSAHGSGNNVANPNLGKAGSPYTRSVSQTNSLPRHQLPDPGLVFDTLLRRDKVRISFKIRLLQTALTPNCLVHTPPSWSLVSDVLICRPCHSFVRHGRLLLGHLVKLTSIFTPLVSSIFRTSPDNANFNETSSYIDLAPLYGDSQHRQREVRNRNGRGMLHPDVFSEDRLLLLPPAVCVLLVLFNRNHNVYSFPSPRCFWSDSPFLTCLVYRPEALGDQRA